MAIENTTSTTVGTAVPAKASGDDITADTYRQMLDVLEQLASHNHIFYDDYATVCQCQCECACGRGTL